MLNSGTGEGESRHRRNNKVDWRYFFDSSRVGAQRCIFYVVKLDCVIKREKKFYDSSKKTLITQKMKVIFQKKLLQKKEKKSTKWHY